MRHQLAALDWADKLPRRRLSARLFRLGTISDLYNAMGLPESALETIDKALAQSVESIPLQNRISLLDTRSAALVKTGDFGAAEKSLTEAEELARGGSPVFTTPGQR
ncbi:MAG TPA: hypothetical protein VFN25_05425 [Dokdonella sp.]|uniref:hypothetical protein n=1 Tax=Dokdonella sp. TaxID=2291710 RepID=UPI002D7E9D4D|nr:hypothetical protein [Dokdonella sp.]HET9032331.1 hypothetical protein [Dokdonella sp.]